MRIPTEEDLMALVTVEKPPSPFLGDSPHPFEPLPWHPAWCARCPLPREHKVHAPAKAEGEQS